MIVACCRNATDMDSIHSAVDLVKYFASCSEISFSNKPHYLINLNTNSTNRDFNFVSQNLPVFIPMSEFQSGLEANVLNQRKVKLVYDEFNTLCVDIPGLY